MTREATKNLPASIRARLLSLAQSRDEDYQRVLGRFAIERFLYRLGRSKPSRQICAQRRYTFHSLDRTDAPAHKGPGPARPRFVVQYQ